jgi:hypothetical protein
MSKTPYYLTLFCKYKGSTQGIKFQAGLGAELEFHKRIVPLTLALLNLLKGKV